MSRGTYYRAGEWLAICDQCGREYNASELQLQWDGLRTCRQCWDYRNPQELIRPVADPVPPQWTRPWVPVYINAPNQYNTRAMTTFAMGTTSMG